PHLGVAQRELASAVAALHSSLGGVRAAMQLEVQLADPHRRIALVGPGRREEDAGSLHREAREPVEVGESAGRLEHRFGRATATVTQAEEIERARRAGVVLEV